RGPAARRRSRSSSWCSGCCGCARRRRRRMPPMAWRSHSATARSVRWPRVWARSRREVRVISRIRGVLLRRELGVAEVMTPGGVAYEIQIPLTVFERLPQEGAEVELRTHQVVREDAVELYGFMDEAERAVFGRLLSASGVGPRLAVNILSTLP